MSSSSSLPPHQPSAAAESEVSQQASSRSPAASAPATTSSQASIPSSQLLQVSSRASRHSFGGRIFLEDPSFPVHGSLHQAAQELFKTSAAPTWFYAARLNTLFSVNDAHNVLEDGDVVYAANAGVMIHLKVDNILVQVACMPADWNTVAPDFADALAEALGGRFELSDEAQARLHLSDLARTEQARHLSVTYNWFPAVETPRIIPVAFEMPEATHFVEASLDSYYLIPDVIQTYTTSFSDSNTNRSQTRLYVSYSTSSLPLLDCVAFSLRVMLCDAGTTLRAMFLDQRYHVIILMSDEEDAVKLYESIVEEMALERPCIEWLQRRFGVGVFEVAEVEDLSRPLRDLFAGEEMVSQSNSHF